MKKVFNSPHYKAIGCYRPSCQSYSTKRITIFMTNVNISSVEDNALLCKLLCLNLPPFCGHTTFTALETDVPILGVVTWYNRLFVSAGHKNTQCGAKTVKHQNTGSNDGKQPRIIPKVIKKTKSSKHQEKIPL